MEFDMKKLLGLYVNAHHFFNKKLKKPKNS